MFIHVSLTYSILCAANKQIIHSQLLYLVNTKLSVFIVTVEILGSLNMLT